MRTEVVEELDVYLLALQHYKAVLSEPKLLLMFCQLKGLPTLEAGVAIALSKIEELSKKIDELERRRKESEDKAR